MKQKNRSILIAIYYHPEAYPPTLNAIDQLSTIYDKIYLLYQPHLDDAWSYPENVLLIKNGKKISVQEQMALNIIRKAFLFLSFTYKFLKLCLKIRPSMILIYDSFPLFSYHLIKKFIKFKHKIWYHNHDVSDTNQTKYTIGWWAARTEKKTFKYLDIFSLPSNERLPYFEIKNFNGKYFFIPNYPSIKFYNQFYKHPQINKTIRIIFQGHISPGHGIEEIIPILNERLEGHELELILKGSCKEDYKSLYLSLAAKHKVESKLFFIGVTSYLEVPIIASTCHIGIGIHSKLDVMSTTLGTASNKLYEYAALGLPILYYRSENFEKHLGRYKWALPTDLDICNIKEAIKVIINSFDKLSLAAHKDFLDNLNFEKAFETILSSLKDYNHDSIKLSV